MVLALAVFGLTYVAIATEKIDRSIAAMLGGVAAIFLGLVPYEEAMQFIDLNAIFLIVGMMIVVNVLAETGVFEWFAISIARKGRGNGSVIFVGLLLATAFLSAFLDSVTTVILMAPVTILITQLLEIPAVPFLILEAIFSNIGGTATMIGNPPSVLIGSQGHLTFNAFLFNLAPIVAIIVVASCLVLLPLFRRTVRVEKAARGRVMDSIPSLAITDRRTLRRALVIAALMLAAFVTSHQTHLSPGIIALAGAMLMLLFCRCEPTAIMQKVEWNTVFFFIGLFIVLGALEHNGVFSRMVAVLLDVTGGDFMYTVIAILWFSAIVSAVLDNIPLVLALIPVIQGLIPVFGDKMGLANAPDALMLQVAEPMYWALALGACLGGNGLLIGASANVVIAQVARRNGYELTFGRFAKYGLPMMVGTLILATIYLYLRYFLLRQAQ